MFKQISAIVAMNIRSIPDRLWMSLATVLAIAVVVAVLLAFLAMGNGFRATLNGSGSDSLAIIVRTGSQAELNSVLDRDTVNLVAEVPGIARDDKGALLSAELYLVVDGKKKSSGTAANLPFRGIDERGMDIRTNVKLTAGRMFEPGKNELIVGEAVANQFVGFDLGNTIKLGRATWTVVGTFSSGGTVFDSELWTDARTLQGQFQRGNTFQVIRARLATAGDVSPIEKAIAADKRLNLEVKTERAYYQEQSKGMTDLIFYIGWPLAYAMALGALAGALNTMYNSVSRRAGEIATLRAIGFSSLPVFTGTLLESLVLAVVGGLLGAGAAYLFFDGVSASTMGSSFTQIVFRFELDGNTLRQGVVLALVIGFIGGFFPALRAARLPVLLAFAASN